MSENPGTGPDTDYKMYSISYLKNLKYLDYELISEIDRENANDRYKEEIAEKDNLQAHEKAEDKSSQQDPKLKLAKIECTEDLFAKVLSIDEDAKKLKSLQKFNEIFQNHD